MDVTPLPLPNLSAMEDATRRRLESLQERVTKLTPAGSDIDLADAYGTLGTYYIAHHLNDSAEVAFVNAERLEPGDFRWPYYLGFVYQMVGKLDLEKEAYEPYTADQVREIFRKYYKPTRQFAVTAVPVEPEPEADVEAEKAPQEAVH